jgi:hypothetical protein
MGKRLIFVLVLALALSFSVAAYAEVQNLKVSGDLLLRAIDRKNFTLNKDLDSGLDSLKYKVGGFTATTRVRIDADLTDNVATTVRLLNERSWGEASVVIDEIDVDLAYVTLKEFLYSPLTLTVGRQELRFGNALVIGDPDTNMDSTAPFVPPDLSARKAFDAIRGTLNYDPLVVDVIYSKVAENDIWFNTIGSTETRDTNLMGVNAKYDLSGLGITGSGELYYFNRADRDTIDDTGKIDICNTIGMLLQGRIRENLTGSLEFAYQFGRTTQDATGTNADINLHRRAWALQTALNLALSKKWSPNLGLMFTYLSGDNSDNDNYGFWDPMYEDQTPNSIVNAILPNTNIMAVNAKASLKPTEDVTVTGVYGYYLLAKDMEGAGIPSSYGDQTLGGFPMTSNSHDAGHALDLIATYDYTEDVQLGLAFGMFDPGKAFDKDLGYERTATQLIGSMKVTF